MSHHQPRSDTRDSSQYKKTSRSGSFQHRGGRGSGGGGGGAGPPPPVPSTSNPSFTSNRSLNKKYSNAQGGQPRVSGAGAGSDSHLNGAHQQQPLRGASDVSAANAHAPLPSTTVKSADASTQKVTRAVPRAPTSNVVPPTSESSAPVTPAKNPGDASKSFPLQFGSISPGVMNVLQIPARTSSAPPNLDEQKRAQARGDTSRAIPSLPNPSTSKQHLPRKDAGPLDQSNHTEAYGVASKPKRDVQILAPPPVTQTQKPSTHPMPGMHMQIPFHQPQVPVQFGGPGPQIPSHSMSATSLQMPMHLPIVNTPMQQPMFVSSLQPHPMQSQGMMHQGQGLNYSSGMGPQLPPQLGSMGMNMASQFSPQQAAKFGGQRKIVKITHPDTHEELRLDATHGSRSHPNMPPQSQPIASFPPGHPNYYPNSYNSNSVFFQAPSSLPLGNTQSSQPPRPFNQVTVKPAAGGTHSGKEQLPSVSSSFGKDPVRLSKPHGGDSAHSQKDTDTSNQSSTTQSRTGDGSKSASRPVENMQSSKGADSISGKSSPAGIMSSTSQAPIESSTSLIRDSIVKAASETLVDPDSAEDLHKKHVTRGQLTAQDKALGKSTSVSSQPTQYPLTRPVEVNTAASVSTATVETRESLSLSESTELKSHMTANFGKEELSEPLDSRNQEVGKPVLETGDRNEVALPEVGKQDENNSSKPPSESLPVEFAEVSGLTEEGSPKRATNANIEDGRLEIGAEDMNDKLACSTGLDNVAYSITSSTSNQDSTNTEACTSAIGPSAQDDQEADIADPKEAPVTEVVVASQEFASDLLKNSDEATSKSEDENTETNITGLVSKSSSSVKEKSFVDSNVPKATVARLKKKKKDIYKKADAAGATSDLYMAYKGPEKKDQLTESVETIELSSRDDSKLPSADVPQGDLRSTKKVGEVKAAPDDWEDAADVSTPKLEAASEHRKKVDGEDGDAVTTKKYSRDFLLKFAEQCIDIPEGFNVAPDIADILINFNTSASREPFPSPGRGDRPTSGHRERRGTGVGDSDKWNKTPGPPMPGRDFQPDLGYGLNAMGFRPGQGSNSGVLRNPRAAMPIQHGMGQYAVAQYGMGQYAAGGILSGPMQSMGPLQGGGPRNGVDADRWQRGTAFQKGLMPSPQTPVQNMHKAEVKYEVGKVTSEEQAKQRQLKAILNKLTPQNFEKLFQQVNEVNIDNVVTLTGVISQIFDKALTEPTFCEMYATFCQRLASALPDLSVNDERITFKRLLLNKCQEEFERGEREELEANVTNEEGEVQLSAEEREEKRVKARRRMLGNIRLIGELYKKRMLTERIMHECIQKLLGDYQNPDEENVEALCKLMSTIGEMIDHAKAKEHMDAYFDRLEKLSNNMKLSSRVRFMLKDSIDLRKNKWQQRRKVEGPKKIEEVHRDAAQERHAQATRLARTPSLGGSNKRGQPMDFGPRGGSMLSSPGSQMGGFRPMLSSPGSHKLTPQNFEKLFQQVKEVNIDNVVTLYGVVSQIFDKALTEPTFCEMYATFCQQLASALPDLSVDDERITFKRLLVNKCQEEFERGEREELEANVTNEEGEVQLSAEEREEKRVKARRRMLGNIRLIGELYKKRMLTERIMHECIQKLLGDYQNPDEGNVEALCTLMSTIGEMIDHAKAKEHMDAYFDRLEKLSNNMKLSSRVRFMLKDSIDLRKNKWQQRRKVEGPKKIEEVHRDAAQERHAQATRLACTPSLGGSNRRGQPMEFGPRGGSMLSSPGSQMGGSRRMSPQVRGYGMQDIRADERYSFENRTSSLPLTQRPLGDDPITLGPQGGLAKGMSSRGQPAGPSIDNISSFGDSRRMTHAQNGYGSVPERPPYVSREELTPKYMPERLSSQHDQSSAPERNVTYGSKERGLDTSWPASPLVRSGGPTSTQNMFPDRIWPEERLRDMSMVAIKEFYSAKDEKEVALCVRDLNSPSFYPSMISLWVTDSFERKDMERDLLTKLIIGLTLSRDVAISQDQLIKGFENVLTTLEDAVNDAPRAAEFLGRIFGKVILENVIPFNEIGSLIYKGGEEEGRLVEIGLAAEVVGSTLEMIKLERGDSVVSEICRSSSLRLEKFRPQGSKKQWKLDKFI